MAESFIGLGPAKVWLGNQSWHYQSLWKYGSERLRIDIRRNAYDDQSYARVDIWSRTDNRWNEIASRPFPMMRCLGLSYAQRTPARAADFDGDRIALLSEARIILET